MIKYTIEDKTLVIPSGLGLGGIKSSSGSGVTPEEAARIASAVTAEALDEYDTELQVDLEDIKDAVSANTQDIAILSGLSTDIATVSGQTTANTQNIGILSGNVETLSQTVAGKQDTLAAGNGITISGTTISVKAGEGLGFSGDTLVVSGGTGGAQNYVIVDDLSEITNPVEGMLAYRREYTEHIVYTGYTMDASSIEEGYVAQIYYDGTNPVAVYRSGNGFYWDWDNDCNGELRKRNDFYYTINSERTVFTVLFNNPDAYVTFEEGVVTATTSTTMSVLHMAVTYLYNGTSWTEYQPPKVYYLNNMTQAERIALYREIYQYSELSFPAGSYRFFVANEGNDEYQGLFEVFVARFYGSTPVSFSGSMQSRYSGTILQRGYEINSNGDFSQTFAENLNAGSLADDFQIRINSNGYIASDLLGNFSSLAKFNKFVFVYQDENVTNNFCEAPLKYFYRKTETVNDEEKLVEYIGVEININGTWYKGDWHFVENEWGEWVSPDTWTTI